MAMQKTPKTMYVPKGSYPKLATAYNLGERLKAFRELTPLNVDERRRHEVSKCKVESPIG